jgi:hypothetical protein
MGNPIDFGGRKIWQKFFSVGLGKFLRPCTCIRIEGCPPKPCRKNARRYEVLHHEAVISDFKINQ